MFTGVGFGDGMETLETGWMLQMSLSTMQAPPYSRFWAEISKTTDAFRGYLGIQACTYPVINSP